MFTHPEITRALAAEHRRDLAHSARSVRIGSSRPLGSLGRRLLHGRNATLEPRQRSSAEIAVSLAQGPDEPAVERVAELDARRAPRGRALVARVDGQVVAALGLDDARLVADPFVATADAIALLRVRAAQMARTRAPARSRKPAAVSATVNP